MLTNTGVHVQTIRIDGIYINMSDYYTYMDNFKEFSDEKFGWENLLDYFWLGYITNIGLHHENLHFVKYIFQEFPQNY